MSVDRKSILRCYLDRWLTTNETGSHCFQVLPMEAGIGKSIWTDQIISEYLVSGGPRRFLIVKRFTEEINASVERINTQCGKPVALGITADNWIEHRDKPIEEWPVVVISHQRYIQLASEDQNRAIFSKGRHALVIDEWVEMPTVDFSDYCTIKKADDDLLRPCLDFFEPIRLDLAVLKTAGYHRKLVVTDLSVNAELGVSLVRTLDGRLPRTSLSARENLNEIHNTVQAMLQGPMLFTGTGLVGYDTNFRRWGLSNNIILDAAGSIDYRYTLDPHVVIDHQPIITQHNNWTLHQIEFNVSVNNVKKYKQYLPKVCKLVADRTSPADKVLVVTHLRFEEEVKKLLEKDGVQNVVIAHHWDIVGRNGWRDYNKVWVITTPLLPMEQYVLHYLRATGQPLVVGSIYEMVAYPSGLCFRDKELEQLRLGCIATETYQAVKRINRDNAMNAEVYVATTDDRVINVLRSQMPGIMLGETIDLEITPKKHRKAEPTQEDKLASYLHQLPCGRHRKADIRNQLGITQANFSRIYNSPAVQALVTRGLIANVGHHIERRSG